MLQQELLKRVVDALDATGAEHMLVGSHASSLQGEPRLTHDIDLVVVLPPGAAHRLTAAFPPPDFYLDEQSIVTAVRTRDHFNLLDIEGGDKVDFWVLKDEPYARESFARRRRRESYLGISVDVMSPEDTILSKLAWAELSGGSEKQFTDALRVYEVQGAALDLPYIERWADPLKIRALWERLKSEADPEQT
jgi:hypothetical protein